MARKRVKKGESGEMARNMGGVNDEWFLGECDISLIKLEADSFFSYLFSIGYAFGATLWWNRRNLWLEWLLCGDRTKITWLAVLVSCLCLFFKMCFIWWRFRNVIIVLFYLPLFIKLIGDYSCSKRNCVFSVSHQFLFEYISSLNPDNNSHCIEHTHSGFQLYFSLRIDMALFYWTPTTILSSRPLITSPTKW